MQRPVTNVLGSKCFLCFRLLHRKCTAISSWYILGKAPFPFATVSNWFKSKWVTYLEDRTRLSNITYKANPTTKCILDKSWLEDIDRNYQISHKKQILQSNATWTKNWLEDRTKLSNMYNICKKQIPQSNTSWKKVDYF